MDDKNCFGCLPRGFSSLSQAQSWQGRLIAHESKLDALRLQHAICLLEKCMGHALVEHSIASASRELPGWEFEVGVSPSNQEPGDSGEPVELGAAMIRCIQALRSRQEVSDEERLVIRERLALLEEAMGLFRQVELMSRERPGMLDGVSILSRQDGKTHAKLSKGMSIDEICDAFGAVEAKASMQAAQLGEAALSGVCPSSGQGRI